MEITIMTLAKCVRAVDAKIKELQKQIDVADDPQLSDLEEELLGYSKAEMELKELYVERQKVSQNFLPYDELVE